MRCLRIAGIVGGLLLAGGAAPALARAPIPPPVPPPSPAGTLPPRAGNQSAGTQADETQAGGEPCGLTRLTVRLGRVDPGAGNRYAPLEFINRAPAACTLRGHPGLAMLDGDGDVLPGGVRPIEGPGEAVTLEPGGTVHAVLHWTVTATECLTATGLRVTPPGGHAATTVSFPGERVCGDLDVTPVR